MNTPNTSEADAPRMTAEEFMSAPATHAVWAQKARTGAWILLSDKCRSAAQAERLRAMYAASSEYSEVAVRNVRRVDVRA